MRRREIMKRFLKSFPLICLLAALLAGTAFADPSPSWG